MRVAIGLLTVAVAAVSSCTILSAEDAVRDHIAAAGAGNVPVLRSLACGTLADQLATHTDDEIRTAFATYYQPKPDRFRTSDSGGSAATVTGYYSGITDLGIAFAAEKKGGQWRVCEVRKGNGVFGALPGPFG